MDETTKPRGRNGREDGPGEPGADYAPHGVLRDPAATAVLTDAPTEVEDVTGVDGVDGDDGVDEYDDADADLLPSEARPLWNRWTIGLVAAVLMVASFGAGAYAQRSTGTDTAANPAAGFGRTGTGSGRYGGQFPGGGQFAGGGQFPGGGTGTGSGTGQSGTGAATPAVIGTVVAVSGNTLTVKNFAGTTVKVTVPDGAAVSVTSTTPLTGLKAGTTVSVTGTKGADGTVTATGVTARPAAK